MSIFISDITLTAYGSNSDFLVPAEKASKQVNFFAIPSAICDLQELPVQRNNIFFNSLILEIYIYKRQ